jgi:hypothetical protein
MPNGKPAGVRCIQLTEQNRCKLFDKPERPRVCAAFMPSEEMCGQSQSEAIAYLDMLEEQTSSKRKFVQT